MKRAVRMADIAQRLDISTVSVSKALAGRSGVSEELRTKVITLAHQMGYSGVRVRYEPGLTGNIGVLVADHLSSGNTFYTDLYRELVLCSSAEGFSCIMEIISQEAEQTAVLPSLAVQQRVDGIIFMGALDPNYLAAVMAVGLPCAGLPYPWFSDRQYSTGQHGWRILDYKISSFQRIQANWIWWQYCAIHEHHGTVLGIPVGAETVRRCSL